MAVIVNDPKHQKTLESSDANILPFPDDHNMIHKPEEEGQGRLLELINERDEDKTDGERNLFLSDGLRIELSDESTISFSGIKNDNE